MPTLPRIFQTRLLTGWIWTIPVLSALFTAGAVVLFARNYPVIGMHPDSMIDPLAFVIGLVYPILGAFIARWQPANPIAWLFCIMGLIAGVYQFSMQYAILSFLVLPDPLPLAGAMSWIQSWAWFVPLNLLVLVVFLYPDGQTNSPGWKIIFWIVAAAAPALILATLFYLWPYRGALLFTPDSQLPAAVAADQQAMQRLWLPLVGLPMFFGMPAAVISLMLRLRRAHTVERQQIKWFLYAGSVFTVGLIITLAVMMAQQSWLGTLLWSGLMPILAAMLPVVVAFAILRYRLFDIDLIIRRTLAYSVLTTILAVIYLVSILLLQTLIRTLTGSESTLAVVASTLLIAALFNPLRQRIQRLIDRRFFRTRYSPETLVADLSAALQTEMDIHRMAQTVVETVDEAVQPTNISVWLLKIHAAKPQDEGNLQ